MNIERLKKALEAWKKIPKKIFYFNEFVAEYDFKNQCGSVCCLMGWSPKYYPELGYYWIDNETHIQHTKKTGYNSSHNNQTNKKILSDHFEANNKDEENVLMKLFGLAYLDDNHIIYDTWVEMEDDRDIESLLKSWQNVIDYFEKIEIEA